MADCSGRWATRWTQSARCEISADVAAIVHATTSLFIFHENGSRRGSRSRPPPAQDFQFPVKRSLTQLIRPSRRYSAKTNFSKTRNPAALLRLIGETNWPFALEASDIAISRCDSNPLSAIGFGRLSRAAIYSAWIFAERSLALSLSLSLSLFLSFSCTYAQEYVHKGGETIAVFSREKGIFH